MPKVVSELRCLRCGHRWFPRSPKQPAHCPNPRCNSPYWNRPRKKKAIQDAKLAKSRRQHRPATPIPAERVESSELDWLEENAQELGRYPGEWLLIQGRRLLLHSRDFAELRAVIREHRIESPFVYYVPTDEEANFIAI
jgi:ribosomal protein L37E